tara:strand:+ start:1469 stop:2035 length:567 start_codon:yes stop_codon:yes gene_type:complete
MKLKQVLRLSAEKQQDVFWNIKVIKPLDSFKYRFKRYKYIPLGDHSYKDADYIKRLFFEDDMESLIKGLQECFKIPLKSLMNTNIVTVLKCLKTIKNDIEKDLEDQNKLAFFSDKKVDMAMKMSKSEVMNQFGLYNIIETLSKGEKQNWDYFLNLKYSEIKLMVAFNAMSGDLNKRFQKNYEQLNKVS